MTKGRAMTHKLMRELMAKTIREKVEEGFHLMVVSGHLKKMVYEIPVSPMVDEQTILTAHELVEQRLGNHICWGSLAIKIEPSPVVGCVIELTRP